MHFVLFGFRIYLSIAIQPVVEVASSRLGHRRIVVHIILGSPS